MKRRTVIKKSSDQADAANIDLRSFEQPSSEATRVASQHGRDVTSSGGGNSAGPSLQGVDIAAAPVLPSNVLPHRKPKNFADRLMRVLLNDVAPDSLWWVGDGKAVAFHSKNLNKGDLLQTHFKTKDYNAFIRNCNRWGFSRTNTYAVPNGVKVYQCSLFQRDSPHLMLHMRMDSDVQDVFRGHVNDDQRDSKSNDKKRSASAAATAATPTGSTHMPPLNQPQQAIAAASHDPQGGALQTILHQMAQAAAVNSGEGNASAQSGIAFAQNTIPFALGTVVPTQVSAMAPTYVPSHTPTNEGNATILHDELLKQILHASQLFLNLPSPSPSSGGSDPLRTVIQMLQIHGKELQEERERQRLQLQNHQNFVMGLLTSAMQQQQGSSVTADSFSSHQAQSGLTNLLFRLAAASPPAPSYSNPTTTQHQDANNIAPGPADAENAQNVLINLLVRGRGVEGGAQLPVGAPIGVGSLISQGGSTAPTVAPTGASSSSAQPGTTHVARPPEGTGQQPQTEALQHWLRLLLGHDLSQDGV